MIAAENPVRQQDVVRLVIPGVVREIALGDEPDVAVSFGEDTIGSSGADARAQKPSHGFPNLDDVVGVDVFEDGGADNLRGGETEDEHGVFVDVDDGPFPAHPHLEFKVDVIRADG